MSRSDPPPRRATTLSMGVTRPSDPVGDERDASRPEDGAIDEGVDVSLDGLGAEDIPASCDRVTVVPPVPEGEYVTRMMDGLPASDRIPASRPVPPTRSLTPPIGSMALPPPRPSARRVASGDPLAPGFRGPPFVRSAAQIARAAPGRCHFVGPPSPPSLALRPSKRSRTRS